ncbi:MAG TPA: DUF2269 family protein [Acidimicrobiia bacterium]
MQLARWLLFLHICGAIVYIGGNILLQILALRAKRDGHINSFMDTLSSSSTGIAVAAVLTILTGIGLVVTVEPWTFATGFVLIGMATVLVSGIADSLYLQMRARRIAALIDEQPDSPEIGALLGGVTRGAGAVDILFILTIWAMVFKPGI